MLEHPDWVRRMNLFAPAVGGGDRLVGLDPDELLALARSTTGLDDVGEDLGDGVGGWEEAYRVSMASMDTEAGLHLVGRLITRGEVLRNLQTRLRLVEHWKRTPAVLDERIEAPVFILGAPRTGTTILFELMAENPALRAPLAWEAHHPLPIDGDPVELAECEQELWADIHPPFAAMHELAARLPGECLHFLALDHRGPHWSMNYARPSFDAWTAGRDTVTPVYTLHERFLQTLQHQAAQHPEGARPTWLLKSPGHAATITQLLERYPDARFVHTHRDPAKFVASVANLMATVRFIRSDDVDPMAFGPAMAFAFRFMLEHTIDLRRSGVIPEDRIADVHFTDLMADPVTTIRRAHDHLGLPFADGYGDAITAYLAAKPRGKHGVHRYDPAELGIDQASVRDDYAAYMDFYGITPEDPA
jgi:hypothetical protein